MTGLTKLALKRPVSVAIIILALIIFGSSTLVSTPLELMPDMEMPMMVVFTTYPGAAPQDVEDQVTSLVEDAASTLSGVKNVQSTSSENVSFVILEMEYGTNMEQAHTDLSNNLDIYASNLPEDASEPTIVEFNMDMMPSIVLSAVKTGDVDLKYYVEEEIVPEFEKLSGVASVSVYGGSESYISVRLKEEMLSQYGLNMAALVSLVGAADFSLPAGSIAQGNLDLTLRGGVKYYTAEDLRALPITLPTGDVIHLSDVATVFETSHKADSISRYNGLDNVTISLSKRQSASTFAVSKAVTSVVNRMNNDGIGVQLEVINDAKDQISSSISAVAQTLIYGVVLAMAVLFLFFGDWRASVIVGSSIPLSLLVTMLAMSVAGFTFNVLSIGGLVIGVGMMVDNSIVVIESCFRLKEQTESYRDAALEGAQAVASSIIASTITTVVVFLPMALIKGMSGQLFGQLCFTIVFSLIASLISALTVVPLVFRKLEPIEHGFAWLQRGMDHLQTAYAGFLPKTLKVKWLVVLLAVGLLVGSIVMIPFIGFELMPETDEGTINISVTTRPGLNFETLNGIVLPLEEMVRSHPDVESYTATSGGSGMSAMSGGGSASLTVYLRDDRAMSTNEVINLWRDATAGSVDYDVSVTASSTTSSMTGGNNIQVNLEATSFEDLETAAAQVEAMMRQNANLVGITSTLATGNPQAEIEIDPIKASARGLVPQQVMGTIYTMMQGSTAATLHSNGRDYDVVVEYPDDRFASITDLASMYITNAGGVQVPLLDIATISYSNSPQSIERKNGHYLLTVSAQPSSRAPATIANDVAAQAQKLTFPAGVSLARSDSQEAMIEEFTALLSAIATAVLLVFMVMAMQFESPRFSLVVMLSIPFALIGSFGALLLSNSKISMTSLMGFLMLAGIVVNNGILFIDTTNTIRRENAISAEDALVTAGMLRMRPIFMTTLTTVLAMIPMAVATDGNAAMMKGMAMVIIGGLIASTVLTLLLLPSFYLLANKATPEERAKRKQEKSQRRLSRKVSRTRGRN